MLLSTSSWAQEQYKIQFTYDSAGNQTLRDRVCVNCGTSKEAVDSLTIEEVALDEDLLPSGGIGDEPFVSNIVAYPNPVTELLNVEWQDNQKQVREIVLFSGVGQQLQRLPVKSRQGAMNLNFGAYPPGRYIVSVFYLDNSRESFHVIKK